LARLDSRTVTICGCGSQGRVQIKALSRVFRLETVFAYDKDQEQMSRFAREVTEELGFPTHAVTDLHNAVTQSDICVTCTPSRRAYLNEKEISPGTFISAVGADNPDKQELHPALMANSKIVTDVLEQCSVMGDLHHALDAGLMVKDDVHAELGEVVAGKKPGRESDAEIIVFDSTGMALQDVAAAARVYEKAQEQGSGMRLSFAA
jgi:ornithine cyclodeaminase/alanine dehydrogenase-like protein (mu-crystallin family)